MNIEKIRDDSSESMDTEYKIVYPDGAEALIELNSDKLGDFVYVEGDEINPEIFSREDLIKGTVDHNRGKVTWEDGKETDTLSEEDVVYARKNNELNELSERQIIPNLMVGRVDKEAKTISFDKLPKK